MKKQISTIIALACFSLATIPAAIAKPDHNNAPHDLRILKELDLTAQQKQDIKTLMKQTRANNEIYAGDRDAFKAQMQTIMNMPTWDESLASQLIVQQMAQKQQIELNKAKAKHAVYQLLSLEQQTELNQKMAEKVGKKGNPDKQDRERGEKKPSAKKFAKRLGLSDEQKDAMKAIRLEAKEASEALKIDGKAFKAAEKALIQAETFDEAAWLKLYEQNKDNFAQRGLIKMKSKYQELALLSAEQKEKMAQMRDKMEKKMRSKMKSKMQKRDAENS